MASRGPWAPIPVASASVDTLPSDSDPPASLLLHMDVARTEPDNLPILGSWRHTHSFQDEDRVPSRATALPATTIEATLQTGNSPWRRQNMIQVHGVGSANGSWTRGCYA